jgi:hypothetical protein
MKRCSRDAKNNWDHDKAKELAQPFLAIGMYRHPLFRAQAERWLEVSGAPGYRSRGLCTRFA